MTDHGKGVGKDSAIGFLLKSFKKLYTLKIRFLTKKNNLFYIVPNFNFCTRRGELWISHFFFCKVFNGVLCDDNMI